MSRACASARPGRVEAVRAQEKAPDDVRRRPWSGAGGTARLCHVNGSAREGFRLLERVGLDAAHPARALPELHGVLMPMAGDNAQGLLVVLALERQRVGDVIGPVHEIEPVVGHDVPPRGDIAQSSLAVWRVVDIAAMAETGVRPP